MFSMKAGLWCYCGVWILLKLSFTCGVLQAFLKNGMHNKDMGFFLKVLDVPLTVKIRTGVQEKSNIAHKLIPEMKNWGVSMITVRMNVIKLFQLLGYFVKYLPFLHHNFLI